MTTRFTLDQQRQRQKARLAEQSGNANAACRIFQKLVQEVPNDPLLLVEYARCCRLSGRRELAISTLNKLLQQHRNHAKAMYHTGVMLQQFRLQPLAIEAYSSALEGELSSENREQIRVSMAFMHERINDIVAAEIHVAALREMNSQDPSCDLIEAILCRRNRELEEAERLLRSCIGRFGNAPLEMRATYELANVLDGQQNESQAFEVLQAAKTILKKFRDFDQLQKTSGWVSQISTTLTQHFEETKHDAAELETKITPGNAPRVCLLTGHPRSGTTLLEQMLVTQEGICTAGESSSLLQHAFAPLVGRPPDVLTAEQLAAPKFNDQDGLDCQQAYIKALENRVRRNQLDKANSNSNSNWIIDKNPEAVVMIPVLKSILPQSKIVVLIRDPRDVCLSCYFQYLPPNAVSINYSTLQRTAEKYLQTMKLWLALRDCGQFNYCEVRYEDLVTAPALTMRRVTEFLNLPFDARALETRSASKPAESVVHSPTYASAQSDVYASSIGRWKRYKKQFDELKQLLDPIVERLGYAGF